MLEQITASSLDFLKYAHFIKQARAEIKIIIHHRTKWFPRQLLNRTDFAGAVISGCNTPKQLGQTAFLKVSGDQQHSSLIKLLTKELTAYKTCNVWVLWIIGAVLGESGTGPEVWHTADPKNRGTFQLVSWIVGLCQRNQSEKPGATNHLPSCDTGGHVRGEAV